MTHRKPLYDELADERRAVQERLARRVQRPPPSLWTVLKVFAVGAFFFGSLLALLVLT